MNHWTRGVGGARSVCVGRPVPDDAVLGDRSGRAGGWTLWWGVLALGFALAGWGAEGSGTRATGLADLADLPIEELGRIPLELVSTASRFVHATTEAPASVSVINREDFQHFGYRTLAEALRSLRGVYVTDDRTYSYLGIRGFNRPGDYNSRVLILVDGHRVNDNVFEGAYIGREFLVDADLIERVEVVRGPSSSLYGSSAFFGVVNVITRQAADVRHAEASVEVGGYESYKGRFSYGGSLTNAEVNVLLSGSYFTSEGDTSLYFPEFDDPGTNDGVAEDLDHESAANLLAKVSWKELLLTAGYVGREKSIPTASWGTLFNDPRYHAHDEHAFADLKLEHAFDGDDALVARLYYDDVGYDADYPFAPRGSGFTGINRDDAAGQLVGFETQFTKQWGEHTFTVGGEVRDNFQQDIANANVDPPHDEDVDERHRSVVGGVFAQAEIAVRTNLLFNAGLRYDVYESVGDAWNPRLGLIYSPWRPTTFKLLYGQAFRAPNVYELYFPLGSLPPNSDLQPEFIHTYELVWEQYIQPSLRTSLSGYYYHVVDLITLDPYTLVFENRDQVEAAGLEAEVEYRLACGLDVRTSYSIQQAQWEDTDDLLANSPEQLFKFNLLAPIVREKVFAGLEVQYTSRALTLSDRVTPWADGYCVLNFTLFSQKILKGLEASASIYNLLDETFDVPGGPGHVQDVLEQNGRSFGIKLTYRF